MRQALLLLLLLATVGFGARQEKPPTPYVFPRLPGFPKLPDDTTNPVTEEGVALGRALFYDPVLSRDSTRACASCHRQEAAFSDAPRRGSPDRWGQPLLRNTPPLFNLAWYPALFWDGRVASLEEQVFEPVTAHRELALSVPEAIRRLQRSRYYPARFAAAFGDALIDSSRVARAIAQFERTLLSYRSRYDRVLAGTAQFNRAEAAGFEVVSDMVMGGCFPCHDLDGSALGVVPGFSATGLPLVMGNVIDVGRKRVTGAAADAGSFKIPSLRNVALTPPYMHDGRFQTLEEVLQFYNEGLHETADARMNGLRHKTRKLSERDFKNIIAFLHTLTDSALITDPAFSNPWK